MLRDIQECCYLQEWDAAKVRVRPLLSQLSIVWPSQAWPFQALPYECQLLHFSSYVYSWHALVINNTTDLSKGLPIINNISTMMTWVKGCQLSTIQVQWRPEWRVASYRRYKYNDDLSEGLSVINDTTNLSEGLPVINNTTDLSERLPVINDKTNLSEELLVINDTSVKITFIVVFSINALMIWVVVLLINALMTCVVNNLRDFSFNQHLMTYSCWPI